MKQFKTILVAVALIFGITTTAQAQETKIAHINVQQLVTNLPAFKAAQKEIQQLGQTYEATYTEMQTELNSTMKRYDAEAGAQTDEENARRVKEVQDQGAAIQQYIGQAQQDLQKKEVDLLKPITEKASETIKKVGRAKGYTFVLDSSLGAGVLLADGYDLMADVKAALGI